MTKTSEPGCAEMESTQLSSRYACANPGIDQ